MTTTKLLGVSTLAAAALALTVPSLANAYPRHNDHHRPHKVRICKVERRGHHHVRVCHWVRR
jgi:hypothetical protein